VISNAKDGLWTWLEEMLFELVPGLDVELAECLA
jgi:hypothetical protein